MKKNLKKLGAIVLALAMVLTLGVTAFAATTLDANGEQGVFTTKDQATSQNKVLKLEKEITVSTKERVTAGDMVVPAGYGFWYVSKGGTAPVVKW